MKNFWKNNHSFLLCWFLLMISVHDASGLCDAGRFGPGCRYVCHCGNGAASCNEETGACQGGCARGYYGRTCQKASYEVTAQLPTEDLITLASRLSKETERRELLEASLLQFQNKSTQETVKRALLEKQLYDLRQGLSYEKKRRTELENQVAKINGVHGSSWSDCTMTCGNGERKRTRTCTNPSPNNVGRECMGHAQDIDNCTNAICMPVSWNVRLIIGGEKDAGAEQFYRPMGVAVNPDGSRFYVVDCYNHRVKIYSDEGVVIGTFGSRGQGNGQFTYPTAIVVNSHDDVIIGDRNNHRIVVCGRNGQFKHKFGKHGFSKGQFNYPCGVAVDRSDNVYVAEMSNNRVQLFTRAGGFIRAFGEKGSAPGYLSSPHSLSVSANTGRVYVADSMNHRVSVFSSEGRFIFTFGTLGTANGQMRNPQGISIDDQGLVFLCDRDNNRVQVFYADGTFISTFGTKGSNSGQFNKAQGLAIMPNGDVIVSDSDNNRIQILSYR